MESCSLHTVGSGVKYEDANTDQWKINAAFLCGTDLVLNFP